MKTIFFFMCVALMASCSYRKITSRSANDDIVFSCGVPEPDSMRAMCGMEFSDDGKKLLVWNQTDICEFEVTDNRVDVLNCKKIHPSPGWENNDIIAGRNYDLGYKEMREILVFNENSRLLPLYGSLHMISSEFSMLREGVAREKRARQKTIPPLLELMGSSKNIFAYGCLMNESDDTPEYVASVFDCSSYNHKSRLYNARGACRSFLNSIPSSATTSLDNKFIAFSTNDMTKHASFHVFDTKREIFTLREQDVIKKQTRIGRTEDNYIYISPSGKYAVIVFNLAHASYFNVGGFHGLTLSSGYNETYVVDLKNGRKKLINRTDADEYFIAAVDETNKKIAFWNPSKKRIRITRMEVE